MLEKGFRFLNDGSDCFGGTTKAAQLNGYLSSKKEDKQSAIGESSLG